MDGRGGSFWTSTAAMLAGIGTLLAALVALATFAVSQHWFGIGNPKEEQATQAVDASGKPLEKLDGVVQWGPQSLLFDSTIDFDTDPPTRNSYNGGNDAYMWDGDAMSASYGMAKWIDSGKPTQNGCYARLATFGTSKNQAFDTGDKFCVMTDKSRIVLLEVGQKTNDGWEITATVWKQRTKLD